MKPNTILIIVALVIVAAGGFWYFSGKKEDAPLTATTFQNESQAQFQTLVADLRPVSFDTGIFSEATFMSLIDLTTDITPETVGRLDPFAPIPGVSGK